MKKANIITTCFNEELNRGCTPEANLKRAMGMLDSFSGLKPDLVCLPEVFLKSGNDEKFEDCSEVTAMAYECLAQKAKELGSYIIAGAHESINRSKFNVAWLIGRNGELAGRYAKYYPTAGEVLDKGIRPGSEMPVFETDFGTVGIAICYDIGWPKLWSTLASKGAGLVVWLAAYDGGFPLQTYAWSNFYHVVSTVRTNHSKIIDKTGRILESTSRWGGWVSRTVDLGKEIFHIDDQYDKLPEIQRMLGGRITIESFSEENIFTLESNDAEWPMERVLKDFGLVTYRDYHKKAEIVQEKVR